MAGRYALRRWLGDRVLNSTLSTSTATTALAVLSLLAGPATALAGDGKIADRTWVGEMTMGASLATGNTDRYALDAEGRLRLRMGRVEDEYRIAAEFAEENKITTAQRFRGRYQSSVDIQEGLFGFGFAQGEKDRFAGYDYELEGGVGFGYRIVETDDLIVSVQGGPGYRYGKVPVPTASERQIFARGSATLDFKLSDNARINDDLAVSWDSQRTKVENTLSLTSKIIGAVSGRTTFHLRANSNPPGLGLKKTDTTTKVQLVYSF